MCEPEHSRKQAYASGCRLWQIPIAPSSRDRRPWSLLRSVIGSEMIALGAHGSVKYAEYALTHGDSDGIQQESI